MYCRPAVKPIFVGLGAAAILAAGGASASAEDSPAPTPSNSGSATPTPTPTPTPGTLAVDVGALSGTVHPGGTVQVRTHVIANGGTVSGIKVVRIKTSPVAAVGGDCKSPYTSTGCTVGELTKGHRDLVESTVTVPKSIKKSGKLTFTITVGAAGGTSVTKSTAVKLVVPSSSPSKKPTKSPSPSKSASPSASATGGKHGSSSGSGSGSGGSGSTGGTASGTTSGTGYVPPSPNSSFQAKNPQVALPPIAAPSPSVAPSTVAVTPESRLRGNKTPVAQDLTFERVASTQVAWLAALMVAIAVLLTQLRLGKRRAPAGAAAIARRAKGVHRRTRRGMFGR
ncbi:hypothetical protein [Actinomadura violacea]|uniref:DUF11 domain-containing protein n=1 Tax=Actinomadura violacea TaxID=2819934 RepID=A0ABS3SBB2_9ACTN|nr:hypothetical protein [Actinomadura violacea]MBO2465863.1 hypothetical protein [Actinomadura violacea]